MLIKISKHRHSHDFHLIKLDELLMSLRSVLEHVYIPSNYHQDSKKGPEVIRPCRNY